jgi:hypothetical protein
VAVALSKHGGDIAKSAIVWVTLVALTVLAAYWAVRAVGVREWVEIPRELRGSFAAMSSDSDENAPSLVTFGSDFMAFTHTNARNSAFASAKVEVCAGTTVYEERMYYLGLNPCGTGDRVRVRDIGQSLIQIQMLEVYGTETAQRSERVIWEGRYRSAE